MPQATVAAIITTVRDGQPEILLTRRRVEPFRGQWCLPGGHIDPGEPARVAVVREVQEETGLDFEASFAGYLDEIIRERGIHAVVLPSEDEVSEIAWFPIEEARSMSLAFTHNEILDRYAGQSG
jgi:8-oxo-dGTP diphosphatase